jgi:hypothetical protein
MRSAGETEGYREGTIERQFCEVAVHSITNFSLLSLSLSLSLSALSLLTQNLKFSSTSTAAGREGEEGKGA